MKKIKVCLLTAVVAAGLMACGQKPVVQGNYGVVPLPQDVLLDTAAAPYLLKSPAAVGYPADNQVLAQDAGLLADYLEQITGAKPKVVPGEGDITLLLDTTIANPEGYRLTVTAGEGVRIAGKTPSGVFYGIQTLRKSLPADAATGTDIELPAVTINDYPRFGYRGMHLDVSRHFLPTDSVKAFIDILALHNLNTLHWHLTDDQGWRIEIKKYPKLTEIGSKRKQTVIGRNSGEFDGKEYGGFYTQDEIRDVVAYAAERHINIVPEIDLPGHQLAALAAYPELGCTGGPYEVWGEWGISDDVICAGNEQAMVFLEDVLTEVVDLFPSQYIHIGGDESPKVRWEKCPKCQARIKELGINADGKHTPEEYLQSYVITRMEKHVASKGRDIIGWDEILEGGLAPNATVMSWRGIEGGIEAANQHHDIIMTPTSYLYFDYYQSTDTDNEPLAIGGYVPLEKVYSFEPTVGIPTENQKYVIGVQANLWREYIPNLNHIEYMVLPRMDALAEVQWTEPDKKDYKSFLPRVARMTKLYDRLGYNYAKHIFDVQAFLTPDTVNNTLVVTLETLGGEGDIYYTLDGTEPTAASLKYTGPVEIRQNADFKAVVIRPNNAKSRIFSESIHFNKATMKPITLKVEPGPAYAYNGASVLADGLWGGDNYKTGRWLGFQGVDVDAVIDLKEVMEIGKVSFNTNVVKGDWIMGASGVTVKVSDDGTTFREVATVKIPELAKEDKDGLYPQEVTFAPVKARYVEVVIGGGRLPAWHVSAGKPAYLFVDEIAVN